MYSIFDIRFLNLATYLQKYNFPFFSPFFNWCRFFFVEIYFIISLNSSSEITLTPRDCAFVSLLPASDPANT